jgi:hypothetical protein
MQKNILVYLAVLLILLITACSSAEVVDLTDVVEETSLAGHAFSEDDPAPEPKVRAPLSDEQPTTEENQPTSQDAIYPQTGTLTGFVHDENGPVIGALVRVQLTDITTLTNEIGYYEFPDLTISEAITLTAWIEGYFPGGGKVTDLETAFDITIKPHYTGDNLHYNWFEFNGTNTSESCAPCHTAYEEWKRDAHSQSAVNSRFLSIYLGTDINGNKGPVEYDVSGRLLPPESDVEYYGPGYRLDYPDRTGNCAACHTPLASKLEPSNTCGWSGCHTNWTATYSDEVPYGPSPTNLTGAAADGIACDFCHKIGEVYLDSETQLPYSARPGISSMRLYRPEEGQQLFFGTFDDVLRRVSYSPLEEESAFCAPCHYGQFGGVAGQHNIVGGVEVYNSYGEWLNSPWSDPETGATCQNCHMPPVENKYFVFPEMGGFERDYKPVTNHHMPGVNDLNLMQNSVTMEATAKILNGDLTVDVAITNDKTGHHVPTGVPYRHMILLVTVEDSQGRTTPYKSGPVLPEWIGDYGGWPGAYFAKILRDEWTGEVPTAAYWREISLVEDTRIAAFETAKNQFVFRAEEDGPFTVHVQLLYRRAYQRLMEQKGWEDPDILMEEAIIEIK